MTGDPRGTGPRHPFAGHPFALGAALLALVAAAILAWQLQAVILIVFAAILIAVLLDSAAAGLRRFLPLGQGAAVLIAILILVLLSAVVFALLGARTVAELSQLTRQLPETVAAIEERLGITSIETMISEQMRRAMEAGTVFSGLSSVTSILAAAATGFLVALAGGIFLALDHAGYREGAMRLFPAGWRRKTDATARRAGAALRAWLLGQLVAMLAVGLATGAGLWLLGVPTPIALAVIAGLSDFVPYVGPVIGAIPAVAVAFVEGPMTAVWVAGLFLLIQQIEGNILIPLIQREAVNLPPPVTLFAVTGFGILFGVAGVVLATPLTVVGFVLIRQLWIPAMAADAARPDGGAAEAGGNAPPASGVAPGRKGR